MGRWWGALIENSAITRKPDFLITFRPSALIRYIFSLYKTKWNVRLLFKRKMNKWHFSFGKVLCHYENYNLLVD